MLYITRDTITVWVRWIHVHKELVGHLPIRGNPSSKPKDRKQLISVVVLNNSSHRLNSLLISIWDVADVVQWLRHCGVAIWTWEAEQTHPVGASLSKDLRKQCRMLHPLKKRKSGHGTLSLFSLRCHFCNHLLKVVMGRVSPAKHPNDNLVLEPKGSTLLTPKPTTWPYPETVKRNSHHHNWLSYDLSHLVFFHDVPSKENVHKHSLLYLF